jgi:uncharacterized protein YkwD
MKTLLIYLLFLLLLFGAITCNAQNFYDSLNKIRAAHGLPLLKKSPVLEVKAHQWLNFLDRHNLGMVHDFDTHDGEVLTNAENPLAWWMNSPSHRRVLLSTRFRKIGIANKNGVVCARLN